MLKFVSRNRPNVLVRVTKLAFILTSLSVVSSSVR